jgi:hypothetical protein
MGEVKKDALRVNFDSRLKLEFHGVKVTSDAGLLAYREIGDAFGLTEMAACELSDNRTGKNTQHSITALLRQSTYSDWVRIVIGFTEKLEAVKMRAVEVYGRTEIGRGISLKNFRFCATVQQIPT